MELSLSVVFVYAAFACAVLLGLMIVLRKRLGINLQELLVSKLKKNNKLGYSPITRSTGDRSLVLVDAGSNKATVTATLRQIMAVDLETAQSMVNSAPSTIMANVSEKEASINKEALEFVGAKMEIK